MVSGCWGAVSVLCILSCGLLAVAPEFSVLGWGWYNIDCAAWLLCGLSTGCALGVRAFRAVRDLGLVVILLF